MTYNVFSGTLNPTHSLTRPTRNDEDVGLHCVFSVFETVRSYMNDRFSVFPAKMLLYKI